MLVRQRLEAAEPGGTVVVVGDDAAARESIIRACQKFSYPVRDQTDASDRFELHITIPEDGGALHAH